MTPNDFGIIRQADYNLFALLFQPLTDISEYEIELVYPEYIAGYYVAGSTGQIGTGAGRQYAIVNISKYDYVLLPVQTDNASGYTSGVRAAAQSGAFSAHGCLLNPTSANMYSTAWALFTNTVAYPYAVLNVDLNNNLPVIGFRRHRSDHVNPLGVIQPINPGILQPGSLQPQVEDPDELDVQDPEEEQEDS